MTQEASNNYFNVAGIDLFSEAPAALKLALRSHFSSDDDEGNIGKVKALAQGPMDSICFFNDPQMKIQNRTIPARREMVLFCGETMAVSTLND